MSVNAQGQLVLNATKLSALRVRCDCMFSPFLTLSAKKNILFQNKSQVLNLSLQFSPRLFSYTRVGGTGTTASPRQHFRGLSSAKDSRRVSLYS